MRELKLIEDKEFLKSTRDMVKAGSEYSGQLLRTLSDYEDYRKVLDPLFSRYNNPNNNIYIFRVTYCYPELVTRMIEIHGNQNFNQLAKIIIKAMGWQNDHMHGFYLDHLPGKQLFELRQYEWFAPYWEDEPHPYFHTDKIKISYLDYMQHPKIHMTFDYGDNHNFDIELLDNRPLVRGEKQIMFPRVASQKGRARAQYPEIDEDTGEYKNIYKNWFD